MEAHGAPVYAQVRETPGHPGRSRRSSLDSKYDAEDESTEEMGSRPRSRASMSRLDTSQRSVLDRRPSTRATTRKTEKTLARASPSKPSIKQARRGRLTASEFASSPQHLPQRRTSLSSQLSQREQRPTPSQELMSNYSRNASPPNGISLQTTESGEYNSIEVPAMPHPVGPSYTLNRREMLYNPSRTQLFRDAETFHHYRIQSVARDIVDRWCDAALRARDRYEHLDRLAAAHDAEILLRQAFEHWRLRLHAKKQAAATERYFKHQERRIGKARDLMLLGKAFTHWVQCAFEERLRITDAQRRILSLKYFRAWREITVNNQLNVRHQGLRKYFGIWKRRYVRSLTDDVRAELVHRESIAKNAYWRWFWAFCERRAPEWRAGRLRRKYFSQWITTFKSSNRQNYYIMSQYNNSIRQQTLNKWLAKARIEISNRNEAVIFNQQNEAAHALQSWRRTCMYAPLYEQVSNMVDWRVAGATFANFVTKHRYERQAEAVSRARVMRNAWTQWNDRLRWQTIAHRIEDRYCLEALYKWVVSERHILLQRLSNERLKHRYLYRLRDESAARHLQRTRSLRSIEDAREKRSLQHYLIRWHSRLEVYKQDERIAFEFQAPKLAQDALRPWSQSITHLQQLDVFAKDAQFFLISRRLLKRWRAASLESKKQKRKNAYVQIRRKQKLILAGSVIQQWRSVSGRMDEISQQADLANQTSLLRFGTTLFDRWQDQFNVRRDQDDQASQHYERRLLERHLYTWIERLEDRTRSEELAELNYDMRVKNVAFTWFNKFRLKIIELKGQEANAENLRSWYEKRHFRNILRQWHDKTAKKLSPQQETTFSSRVVRTRPRAVIDEGPTGRAEDWTDFDIGDWIPALEAQSSTTPLPGYLSTPSKRAAHAKAVVKISTTPAGTPFEQRLRSQIGSTPRTARRGGFGRSTNATKGSTFGAILEDSPKTPGMRRNE